MNRTRHYYNENDAFAAQWLRNLIAAGQLPAGDVDDRSIADVQPSDLGGYDQCHFFAGIGGWPLALRLAGWPDDRPVWTGSCPCQPIWIAGKHRGHADERHLWPAFFGIIAKCRPPTVFGEQVAGKDGREWLAGIRIDLESAGYACGAADLCAAGVGAPHIRQRLYWVGNAESTGLQGQWRKHCPSGERDRGFSRSSMQTGFTQWNGTTCSVECTDGPRRIPAEPALFPVVDGTASGMVGRRSGALKGAGNAIVPQVAAAFVQAVMECAP